MSASRIASEIWSHILSGCPSETDSEVKKKSFRAIDSSARACSPRRFSITKLSLTDGFRGSLMSSLSSGDVSVSHLHPMAVCGQMPADLFDEHHGAVPASGAAERQREVGLAFVEVARQQ